MTDFLRYLLPLEAEDERERTGYSTRWRAILQRTSRPVAIIVEEGAPTVVVRELRVGNAIVFDVADTEHPGVSLSLANEMLARELGPAGAPGIGVELALDRGKPDPERVWLVCEAIEARPEPVQLRACSQCGAYHRWTLVRPW